MFILYGILFSIVVAMKYSYYRDIERQARRSVMSTDCFGYERWSPTACQRCGYEKADCRCVGEFAAPEHKGWWKRVLNK